MESSKTLCSQCMRFPRANEHFKRCDRCTVVIYCSRQCQKIDWPDHKASCTDAERQRKFVSKCVRGIIFVDKFGESLSLAVSEEYYDTFITAPNKSKMWVALFHLSISPNEIEDEVALKSLDVPLSFLLKKPMVGSLMITEITDASNLEAPSVDDSTLQHWQDVRDEMDDSGLAESHVVLVLFVYMGDIIQSFVKTIHMEDLDNVRINRGTEDRNSWHKKESTMNSGLSRLNTDIIPKSDGKFNFPLGDDDKRMMREEGLRLAISGQ
ncbi:hypothetical protein GALMADRAFT_410335 [Galerina marginata CBS 339.88]|uniref:MYND-type domain-containing protein n=1 Tax=Galerina marginata (strain CBS 339.88) TaxID=685588 RepID=A0A067TFB3_GALM3|nr:hypothetical protein GALMADRAFT_410335 [Galerina marginata CBS 339.88]